MSQVSSTKKLLSASAVMAAGTMISRVLGMLRVMLIAFILGNGTRQADILGIATMVPNALYILFAGGALNTVLVPQIVRAIKNDDDGGEAFTNRIMTAFMLIVGIVAVVMTVSAPLITMLYSDSAWRGPDLASQYASMVALTYLTLPQIFFYGAFFLLSQVLNARDKFGPMMWAPIANNVVSIIVLSTYFLIWGNEGDKSVAFTTDQILLLGLGATLGIATQAAVLLPFLRRIGFKLRPRFDLKGTGLGRTFSLTKWTLGFVAVNQLALVVVNRLATTATAGGAGAGVNVYSNAHLLWILPHSLVTTSLATAMLSNASRLAADGDRAGVAAEMTKTARLALIFLVPATAVFLSLATPTANLLFGHGKGTADADWVGWALMAFAVGLIPFTVQFICLRTYYALEDTRTPFLLQIGIASINAGAAILFVWLGNDPAKVATMLALAYSLAYIVGVFISWRFLRRRLPDLDGIGITMHIVRLLLGAIPGAVAAFFLQGAIRGWIPGTWGNLLAIMVGGVIILLTTVVIGKLLKIRELRRLSELLRRRRRKPAATKEQEPEAIEDDEVSSGTLFAPPVPMDSFDDDPPTMIRPRIPIPGEFDDPVPGPQGEPSLHQAAAHREVVVEDVAEPEDSAEIELDEFSDVEEADLPSEEYGWSLPFFDDDTNDDTMIVPSQEAIGEAGQVLGVRYQLGKRLTLRARSETWLAHDQVLSRDVIAHVMAADDPNAELLLNAARRGAAATDSRFLRVLDVEQVSDEGRVGVYAISEHSPGRTLDELFEIEPLSTKDGAYIAREVADALSTMHAQGLFHERLDPQHILITPSGAVRIVGFGTASVLEGGDGERPWSQREGDDVMALAAILRATQTGEFSPDPEPAADGYQLSDAWQAAFDGRIATMKAFADALPDVDASTQLESKMTLASRAKLAHRPRRAARDPEPAPVAAPANAVTITAQREQPPRRILWALVAAAVVCLIIGLASVAIRDGAPIASDPVPGSSGSPSGTPSESAEGEGPLKVTRVTDFDPEADNGNGEEFPDLVGNVIDGKDDTSWTTMRYLRRPNMGGLKPGVGLVLKLDDVRTVTKVEVTFVGKGPTTVELRAPKGGQASTKTVKDWDVVAAASEVPAGKQTIELDKEHKTDHLLVYVTSLPPVEGGFQAEIAEITVLGR